MEVSGRQKYGRVDLAKKGLTRVFYVIIIERRYDCRFAERRLG